MTNTVFPTFPTQYILDLSSTSRSGTGILPNTEIFQSKDVASVCKVILMGLSTVCAAFGFFKEKKRVWMRRHGQVIRKIAMGMQNFSKQIETICLKGQCHESWPR
jgi:hypothetical protein